MRWKIWRLWLTLRPLIEHLIGRRIGLIDYYKPVILTQFHTGHLKRDFEDAFLGTYSVRKAQFANVMEMVSKPSPLDHIFYIEPPVPCRWTVRKIDK